MLEHSPTKLLAKDEQEAKQKQIEADHNFYSVKWEKDGSFKMLSIKKAKIVDKLMERNFFRFDIDTETSRFIYVNNNLVKEVNKESIVDIFMDFIENIEPLAHKTKIRDEDGNYNQTDYYINAEMIRHCIFEKITEYFSKAILFRLVSPVKIELKKDTRNEKFLYYTNGFVRITKDGFELLDYSKLDKFIWENQRLNREFKASVNQGIFEKFLLRVCGHKAEFKAEIHPDIIQRLKCLKSIIGYLIHNYFDYELKNVIITDSRIGMDGEANGGTGKTLFGKALARILNHNDQSNVCAELNGKDFDFKDKHKYQDCSMETQLLVLNDIPKNYDIEEQFNDITEGIKVNPKNEKAYRVKTKILTSTNKTIYLNGESALRRVIQFEFSDFFNSQHSPQKEFGCWFFTDDWDAEEWNAFDTYMISCVIDFFRYNLIEPASINLHRRTLIDHSSMEFVEFMDELIKTGTVKTIDEIDGRKVESNLNITFGEQTNKSELYQAFLNAYPNDYDNKKFKQRAFTKWLRMYTKHSPEFKEITKENHLEGRSNSVDWIIFEMINTNP